MLHGSLIRGAKVCMTKVPFDDRQTIQASAEVLKAPKLTSYIVRKG